MEFVLLAFIIGIIVGAKAFRKKCRCNDNKKPEDMEFGKKDERR